MSWHLCAGTMAFELIDGIDQLIGRSGGFHICHVRVHCAGNDGISVAIRAITMAVLWHYDGIYVAIRAITMAIPWSYDASYR